MIKSFKTYLRLLSLVTYTVSGGEKVNPLTNYFSSSNLAMFSLNVGLALKF